MLPNRSFSHRVVQHHVLLGQLQQHRIVEELADAHVLAQTLWGNRHGTWSKTGSYGRLGPRDTLVDVGLTLRLRVLIMNSLARWGAGWGSRGRITMLLSRGSPGTICRDTRETVMTEGRRGWQIWLVVQDSQIYSHSSYWCIVVLMPYSKEKCYKNAKFHNFAVKILFGLTLILLFTANIGWYR